MKDTSAQPSESSKTAYTVVLVPDPDRPGYWKHRHPPARLWRYTLETYIQMLKETVHANETQELHGRMVEQEKGRVFRYMRKTLDNDPFPMYEMVWEK